MLPIKPGLEAGTLCERRRYGVRGVLLWNVWEQVEAARALIRQLGPLHADDLKGRLPA